MTDSGDDVDGCDGGDGSVVKIQSGTHLYVEMEGREGLGCAQLSITQVGNFLFLWHLSIFGPQNSISGDQQSPQLSQILQGSITATRAWDITISQVICPGGCALFRPRNIFNQKLHSFDVIDQSLKLE